MHVSVRGAKSSGGADTPRCCAGMKRRYSSTRKGAVLMGMARAELQLWDQVCCWGSGAEVWSGGRACGELRTSRFQMCKKSWITLEWAGVVCCYFWGVRWRVSQSINILLAYLELCLVTVLFRMGGISSTKSGKQSYMTSGILPVWLFKEVNSQCSLTWRIWVAVQFRVGKTRKASCCGKIQLFSDHSPRNLANSDCSRTGICVSCMQRCLIVAHSEAEPGLSISLCVLEQ